MFKDSIFYLYLHFKDTSHQDYFDLKIKIVHLGLYIKTTLDQLITLDKPKEKIRVWFIYIMTGLDDLDFCLKSHTH